MSEVVDLRRWLRARSLNEKAKSALHPHDPDARAAAFAWGVKWARFQYPLKVPVRDVPAEVLHFGRPAK